MIRVAVIEDHRVLIEALEMMFSSEGEFDFVGAATNIEGGLNLVKEAQPDVLLLDVGLPDGDGLDLVPEITNSSPDTQIVIMTGLADDNLLLRAIDTGVSGFVSKDCSLADLLSTVREVSNGEIVMPSHMLVELLKRVPRRQSITNKDGNPLEGLTPREYEILVYLAQGLSGDAIAVELHIAPLTVRTHIRNMMSKLGVHSRLEAVSYALNNGLIELST